LLSGRVDARAVAGREQVEQEPARDRDVEARLGARDVSPSNK